MELITHKKTAHQGSEHCCDYCSKVFPLNVKLQTHLRKIHKRDKSLKSNEGQIENKNKMEFKIHKEEVNTKTQKNKYS